jgi:hypothetical protein
MVRSVLSKVMWVGRATVFLVGLAVILALVIGLASAAFAGTGFGAPFNLGKTNTVDRVSTLVNSGFGPALSLQVSSGAPLKVNSAARVAKLNADMVDGMHVSQLAPRAYARVDADGDLIAGTSKGINGVQAVTPSGSDPLDSRFTNNLYCFDLTFDNPKAAIGSPFISNNATIATSTDAVSPCQEPFTDAAVRTRAANLTDNMDTPVSFSIAFM